MPSESSKDGGASRRDFLIGGAAVVASAVGPSRIGSPEARPRSRPNAQPSPARRGVWDSTECALVVIDYQENVLDMVFEQDRRIVELNARTLAMAANEFKIPVVLSTVAVKMGINKPTISSLTAALPNVNAIDRSSMDAWEDPAFVAAVKATGRRKLVMAGIVTSVCLSLNTNDALALGYQVLFIEDAVADSYKEWHDIAVMRLTHAGAVPSTTNAIIAEWFRDWESPLANGARRIFPSYFEEIASYKKAPQFVEPRGFRRT